MKIKGQHGEFGWVGKGDSTCAAPKRQVEIEEYDSIRVMLVPYKEGKPQKEELVIAYLRPGVLTLDWTPGEHI